MYEYTKEDRFIKPHTYQFSDVSSDNFLQEYFFNRESFLNKIKTDKKIVINLKTNQELLKKQKKFEVKKKLDNDYIKNIKMLLLFSFEIYSFLQKEFCYSLFSTFLKVNDYLISFENYTFLEEEKVILNIVLRYEVNIIKGLINEN